MAKIKVEFRVSDSIIQKNSLQNFLNLIKGDMPDITGKVLKAAEKCWLALHREQAEDPAATTVVDESATVEPEETEETETQED